MELNELGHMNWGTQGGGKRSDHTVSRFPFPEESGQLSFFEPLSILFD